MNWAEIASWGLIAAGAALAFGNGAALVVYRRTGRFPQQPEDVTPSPAAAWTKLILGVVLAVWGIATLSSMGRL